MTVNLIKQEARTELDAQLGMFFFWIYQLLLYSVIININILTCLYSSFVERKRRFSFSVGSNENSKYLQPKHLEQQQQQRLTVSNRHRGKHYITIIIVKYNLSPFFQLQLSIINFLVSYYSILPLGCTNTLTMQLSMSPSILPSGTKSQASLAKVSSSKFTLCVCVCVSFVLCCGGLLKLVLCRLAREIGPYWENPK